MKRSEKFGDALEVLSMLLGSVGFLDDEADLARHSSDASTETACIPLAVLRPKNTDQLVAVMRLCHHHGLPVVPQGGRTGLSGGAVPVEGSVALSLERMVGVISVDPVNACLTAWAGTPLEMVQEAARAVGFEYAVDIGARGTATIGGTIATNAGGIRVIRHGMTRQNVLGLEVVLADGTLVSNLRSMLKDNAGFDLKQMFVGSEGCLGVISRAVLLLSPAAESQHTVMLAVADYDRALSCLQSARRHFGAELVAFEAMWPAYWRLATATLAKGRSPFEEEHGIYLLVETTSRDAGSVEDWFQYCFEMEIVSDGVLARSLSEARAMWAIREAVGEVDAYIGPHLNFDVGLAPSQLGEFAQACDEGLADLLCQEILHLGHIADGNLHVIVPIPNGDAAVAHEIERRIFQLLSERRGSVSAEHGVGTLKRPWLDRTRSPEELELMRLLKRALDPKAILNPEKVIKIDGFA